MHVQSEIEDAKGQKHPKTDNIMAEETEHWNILKFGSLAKSCKKQ